MRNMIFPICFSFFVALLRSVNSSDATIKHNALFFDWKQNELLEINKSDEKAKYSFYLSACPASSVCKSEEQIKKCISISGNAVFLQYLVYRTVTFAKDIPTDICDDSFVPAIVWNTMTETYEIGYELYYNDDRILELEYEGYGNLNKVVNGQPTIAPRELPHNDVVQTYEQNGNTKFYVFINLAKKWVFYWIQVLQVNVSKLQPNASRLFRLKKDRINDYFLQLQTTNHCESYYSGSDGQIMGEKEQTKNKDRENDEKNAQNEESRLVKTQIVPMLMFHTLAARRATCVYLNIAFVWQTIANEHLKDVDLFLYTLYRLWPDRLQISFGVMGQLQVAPERLDEIASSEEDILRKFPIPEIIYRHVSYTLSTDRIYHAVIVLHNELNSIQDNQRVCSVQEELRWHYVKNPDARTGFTYTCPLTKAVSQKLQLEAVDFDGDDMPTFELNRFPYFRAITKQVHYKDVILQVYKKLDFIKYG